jgi:hypothetical protein
MYSSVTRTHITAVVEVCTVAHLEVLQQLRLALVAPAALGAGERLHGRVHVLHEQTNSASRRQPKRHCNNNYR